MLKAVAVDSVASRLSTLGRLQVVATRGTINGTTTQGTAGGRTDVRFETRRKHFVGNQAVTGICLAQVGYYLTNGENAIGNDFIWETAIEITSPATYQEMYVKGTNTPVINGTLGVPLVITDPAVGYDIAAGGSFYVRQAVSVNTDTLFLPTYANYDLATGDAGVKSPSASSQIPGTGNLSNPSGGSTNWAGADTAMVLGIPAAPMVAVCLAGDSILAGVNDTIDATTGALGWFARGLNGVNGYPVPYSKQAIAGDRMTYNTLDVGAKKRVLWPYHTHIVFNYGSNDITHGDSLATMQANAQALWTAAKRTISPYGKPLQVAHCTIFPRTTSSDSWATAANQTVLANFGTGGIRDQFNTWLPTQVGGGLLDAVIDATPYIEDQANHGKWISNNSANYATSDGAHPNAVAAILAQAAANAWALNIAP